MYPVQGGRVRESDEIERRCAAIADQLTLVHCASAEATGIRGVATGALYALRQAYRMGYRDRTGPDAVVELGAELSCVARQLQQGESITARDWLAGFYFNAAMLHLDAAAGRLSGITGSARKSGSRRDAPKGTVSRDAGHLKHRPPGLIDGRSVALAAALRELEGLAERLAKVLGEQPAQ